MTWDRLTLAFGILLVAIGHGLGLFVAPEEAMMREVGRILYVHVPTAWVSMVTLTAAFVCAVGALWTSRPGWDAAVEATVEVGVLLSVLLLFQGSIWARPTWGVWWTWDPRLTTAAVTALSFAVIMVLRQVLENPQKRATITGVATVLAYVNVPITYMSVKWWRTLHQNFSSPETVDSMMVLPLRVAAFGMLFFAIGAAGMRWRVAMARLHQESSAPDLPDLPEPVTVDGGA